MNKLSKDKKQQLILVCVGAAAALGLIWWQGILPLQDRNSKFAAKIIESRQKEADASKLVKATPQIREELEALSTKLALVEDRMVSGDTNVWIRTAIIGFKSTGAYRVEIPQFSTADGVKVGVLPEFPYDAAKYRITGSAYYHNLGRFLADLENYFPYARVQNLELYPADASAEDREKLNFSMEIVALIKPAAAKTDKP